MSRRPGLVRLRVVGLAAALLAAPSAWAQVQVQELAVPTPRYPVERPTLEVSSWLGLGAGALLLGRGAHGVFDLRFGGDVTLPITRQGDVRVGPFGEVGSANFASLTAVGGLELFLGAVPRPLHMFFYSGEGTLLVRVGGGWSGWSDLPEATMAPVASVTVAYGYRCPFSLREYADSWADAPGQHDTTRYMVGVRLWVNTTVGFAAQNVWQLTGGIEFEPVGSFRYIFGLY